jgi:hypothetical protein
VSGFRRSRASNGRYRRATLANTFGLQAWVCAYPDCRSFNPLPLGEGRPKTCHACDRAFVDVADPPAPAEETKP